MFDQIKEDSQKEGAEEECTAGIEERSRAKADQMRKIDLENDIAGFKDRPRDKFTKRIEAQLEKRKKEVETPMTVSESKEYWEKVNSDYQRFLDAGKD